MPLELPDLSGLPMWQQVLAVVVVGVTVGAGLLITRLGFLTGKNGGGSANDTKATVAAVIVDSSSLDRLTGEAAGLQLELAALNKTFQDIHRASSTTANVLESLMEEMGRLREEIRVMREVANARK